MTMQTTRGLLTKALHLILLVAVLHQLVSSRLMIPPGRTTKENLAYETHEYVGLASLAVVIAFWMWSLVRTREVGFSDLFPWFSPSRTASVWKDLLAHVKAISRRTLPNERGRPFPTAVHGLGLSAVTVMAATGSFTLVSLAPASAREASLGMHELVSNLVWIYLIGHAGLALVHEALGHRLLRDMFSPKAASNG
jgi:cytochrome b561